MHDLRNYAQNPLFLATANICLHNICFKLHALFTQNIFFIPIFEND